MLAGERQQKWDSFNENFSYASCSSELWINCAVTIFGDQIKVCIQYLFYIFKMHKAQVYLIIGILYL